MKYFDSYTRRVRVNVIPVGLQSAYIIIMLNVGVNITFSRYD